MQGQISFPRHAINVASSSLGKDLKNYVYFSNDTRGTVGRAVKINPDLFAPFLAMVDPSSFQGRNIIKAITDLRATAGHLNSQANARNSFEYRLTIENVAVRYRVCSEEIGAKGTVYITQIEYNGRSKDKAGIYSVQNVLGRRNAEQTNSSKFAQSTVYINGADCEVLDKASAKASERSRSGSCLLVFSNSDSFNSSSTWKVSHCSAGRKNYLVAKLTQALELNAGDKKEWIAEGEGAALLLEAIKDARGDARKDLSYQNNKFSNYKFKIYNPVADTPKLLDLLRKKNAVITEQVIVYDSPNRAALVSAAANFSQINQKLSHLGTLPDFNKTVSKKFNDSVKGPAVAGYNAAKPTPNSTTSFVQAINQANGAFR